MRNDRLTSALDLASQGKREDIEAFYLELLQAKLYVPLLPSKQSQTVIIPTIGDRQSEELPYLFVEQDSATFIPIFSEEKFLQEWIERETQIGEEDFITFIWKLPKSTWLYLNPNQPVGKEISPWETQLLKSGKDAIPDIVSGVMESEQQDFEIESPSDDLLKLLPPLLPVLEIYPDLQEAYLLSIKEAGSSSPRALIGLRFIEPFDEEKRTYLRSEIERTAEEHLDKPFTGVFIVDDLGNENSHNHALFLDTPPFYSTLN